jgi:hypothetical protein
VLLFDTLVNNFEEICFQLLQGEVILFWRIKGQTR